MGPEKWKGEVPAREASELDEESTRESARRQALREGETDQDRREDEGWSQPESSAQKTPPLPDQP